MCCAKEDGFNHTSGPQQRRAPALWTEKIGVVFVRVGSVSIRSQLDHKAFLGAPSSGQPFSGGDLPSEHDQLREVGSVHFYEELHKMSLQATVLHAEEYT